jgi:hypothetical protein
MKGESGGNKKEIPQHRAAPLLGFFFTPINLAQVIP